MAQRKIQCYKFIAKMQEGETQTAHELAHELNTDLRTAARHLKEMWTLELIYICGWDREHHTAIPVYRWGSRPDVERPPTRTRNEIAALYRARKREANAAHQAR